MVEYGYMEDGYLRSQILEPFEQTYKDSETGEIKQRTISIQEQIEVIKQQGWKPVDPIDEVRQNTDRENYVIRIIPYDAGDRISYMYVEIPDVQKIRNNIAAIKNELTDSDYKIVKCYEANLEGTEMPYNTQSLIEERKKMRNEINQLQTLLNNLENE